MAKWRPSNDGFSNRRPCDHSMSHWRPGDNSLPDRRGDWVVTCGQAPKRTLDEGASDNRSIRITDCDSSGWTCSDYRSSERQNRLLIVNVCYCCVRNRNAPGSCRADLVSDW